MLEKLIAQLIINLKKDLQDYVLLKKLANESKVEIDQNNGYSEESPIHTLLIERTQLLNSLKIRAEDNERLKKEACTVINEKEFRVSNLQERLSKEQYTQLLTLSEKLTQIMLEASEDNKRLISYAEQELESTKLELHRLRGGQRIRQAYQQDFRKEALFIDRNR